MHTVFFFFKQKTAYEMRISDWSSDVCSSDLQDFYDTAFPILEKSTDYLKSVSLDDISDEDTNLLRIFESLVTVSFPIEVWRQQRVPESGAAVFNAVVEPAV